MNGDVAKTLIEKICNATGCYFEPMYMKRIAKAKVEVEKIEALGALELTEIQERGLLRLVQEEGKKQENIENIIAGALPLLNDDAKPENIENDWVAYFFDQCKLISDEEMQSLWSRILASEANSPKKFSKRTLDFIRTLDKEDAEVFTNFCSFIWDFKGRNLIIYNEHEEVYQRRGVNFTSITNLESMGLIKYSGYEKVELSQKIEVSYFGTQLVIKFNRPDNNRFDMGNIYLSNIGKELASVCRATKCNEYFKQTLNKWNISGVKVLDKDGVSLFPLDK